MNSSSHIGIDCRLYAQTGVGRYIRCLIRELAKFDSVNKYTLFIRKEDRDDIVYLGENFTLQETKIHWHTLSEQLFLPLVVNRKNVDIMHYPYFSVPVFSKKPFIVTIHDLTPQIYPTGKASTLPKPIYEIKRYGYVYVIKHAIEHAAALIVPTHAIKEQILEYYPGYEEKITVTYEGVDVFSASAERPLPYPYILYVGNAYPHKNLDRFLKLYAEINHTTKVVLVGEIDSFYMQLQAKWQQNANIVFYGKATDEQLANLYTHAEALFFPSISEGFGLPALEAMAYGCLTCVSDIPALREICSVDALYFNPENDDSLSALLRSVMDNPAQYKDYKRRGKIRAEAFHWKSMAEKTLSLYERCISIRSSK